MSIRRRSRRRAGQRGQVLPLMAGGMVALILFVGLVIDTGVAFQARRATQNVADLASMAGTRLIAQTYLDPSLTLTSADVWNAIDESVRLNGCEDPCAWTAEYVQPTGAETWGPIAPVTASGAIPAGAQGVTVTTDREQETFFIRVIGMNEWDVAAKATAMTSQLADPPPGILIPIGVFDADYEANREYTLTEGYEGPGNFGWISWLGSPERAHPCGQPVQPQQPGIHLPDLVRRGHRHDELQRHPCLPRRLHREPDGRLRPDLAPDQRPARIQPPVRDRPGRGVRADGL